MDEKNLKFQSFGLLICQSARLDQCCQVLSLKTAKLGTKVSQLRWVHKAESGQPKFFDQTAKTEGPKMTIRLIINKCNIYLVYHDV